ncbi:probable glycosyltransferase STELLO2 [Nymphaea colorata]|nr:probable glycosyltransferase STELLO2 [Nymphaea colorata]
MFVQDRSTPAAAAPNLAKPQFKTRTSTLSKQQHDEKEGEGGGGLSFCLSHNLFKVFFVVFAVVTLFFLLFLLRSGDTAAFLCLETVSRREIESRIPFPEVQFSSIPAITDTSKFSAFRAERWIVISVSSAPTDSLRDLSKIKGWQLLAIGNADTPKDWQLKGTIFLSLDDQAKLGFRIISYLPYNSYVRKNVGYLFAIQHGAKKIYDADDRVQVIGGDLGKHFDLELVGEAARRETMLQYVHGEVQKKNSSNPGSPVVNPYIHFGQRSVWPRGLPLENVGDLGHEEFYTEVYDGMQFIQQGLSNGLPDVDSVFYFTRKSNFETFDIKFDDNAPRVALPQGLMAPVNSFNTLFLGPAFWGLMLPVSISSMASDVIRGYWAQRILWEMGGFLAVYPPTVHRVDRAESYPFAEEKDLHINVGRLVKFLVAWRSNKRTLFERILHLSYSMAEEGFWTEKDVKFTVAWLLDLLAVGYVQPRLMTLELDRGQTVIGHGDPKEFYPPKLPSMHLGVQEAGTVNSEIGDLIQWRKSFGNVVLIMYCDGSRVNHTALEWKMLYGRIFKRVVILSEQGNPERGVENGGEFQEIYKFLPKIFDRFPNAEGFLFLHDTTILNYWNLLGADKNKLWITDKVPESWKTKFSNYKDAPAYLKEGAEILRKLIDTLPVHFQVNYKENVGNEKFVVCTSDVFYVPRRFVGDFADLVGHVGDQKLHQKLAVPMFFLAMDSPSNFDSEAFRSMVYRTGKASDPLSFYSVQAAAVHPWTVSADSEFMKLIRAMSSGDPLLLELL